MGDLDWTVCAHCAHAFPAVEEACTRCGTQRDDVARPWQAGDLVSLPMHGGARILRLSASDADDLNAGENPLYPWRITGPAVLLEAAGDEEVTRD